MSEIKKRSVQKVLNSLSNQTVIESFSQIEQKITKLLSVSAEDFLKLNDTFQHHFKDINTIAQQSSATFKDITSESQTRHINSLNENAKKYIDLIDNLEYQIQKCYSILKNITKNFSIINLNVKNFKQNLNTLKVLITNLKIVSITDECKKGNDEIDKLIDAITDIHPSFEEDYSIGRKMYENSIKTVEALRAKIDSIKDLYQRFINGILNSETKFNEALRILPILNDNSKLCTNDLESIITNLQYQDIVSQKIEHIKNTHNHFIDKLEKKPDDKNASDYATTKAKTYVQISDICGLQAAQLIHSSKEYQKALSSITSKFNEISETIESVYNITIEFFDNAMSDKNLTINDLMTDLKSYKEFSNELVLTNNIFELQIESLILKSEGIIKYHSKLETFTTDLNAFYDVIKSANKGYGAKRLLSNNLKQIRAVADELIQSSKNLIDIKSDNDKLLHFLQKEFHDSFLRLNIEKNLQILNDNSEDQITDILEIYRNAYNIFVTSLSNSSEIASNIRNAINDVKYYDVFELETEGIVSILENLNKQLHEQDKEALREVKEYENLKSNYTVQSEHDIHAEYTKNIESNDEIYFDDSLFENEVKNEDDDNLELF